MPFEFAGSGPELLSPTFILGRVRKTKHQRG